MSKQSETTRSNDTNLSDKKKCACKVYIPGGSFVWSLKYCLAVWISLAEVEIDAATGRSTVEVSLHKNTCVGLLRQLLFQMTAF